MKVPSPRVRVITWSKQMRLRRRFEVRLIDGGDGENLAMGSSAEGVPLARFARKEQAVIFARAVRAYFRSWASTLAPLPIGTGEP